MFLAARLESVGGHSLWVVWLLLLAPHAGGTGGASSVSNARLADYTLRGAATRFDFPRVS